MRRETFLRLAETNGEFALMVDLAQQPTGEAKLGVPMGDIMILAVAKLLAEAAPAVEEAMSAVMDAYQTMADETDPVKAVEDFNSVIGVQVYSVEPKQENTP